MANGDIAASYGMTTIPGTNDIRDGYDGINKLADELTEFALAGNRTEYTWRGAVSGTVDAFTADTWTPLLSLSMTDAPAGKYLIAVNAETGTTGTGTTGSIRIIAQLATVVESSHQVPGGSPQLRSLSVVIDHLGGTLLAQLELYSDTDNGTVHPGGTNLQLTYLGTW